MGNIYQVLVKVRVSTDNILKSKLVLVRMFKVGCNHINSSGIGKGLAVDIVRLCGFSHRLMKRGLLRRGQCSRTESR